MSKLQMIARGSFLFGLLLMVTACVVEPREGYYDRDHARWYHEHGWRDCGHEDEHCR
jgi:hypothetical protein